MKGKVQTFFRILLIIGIVSLIIAILLSLLGAAYLLNIAREDISSLILLSGNKGSASKLYSYDSDGKKTEYAAGELSTGKLNDYAELNDIPDHLQNAFIAIEDKRFYSHLGFDPITTVKAAFKYVFVRGHSPGGSTITQQLIKNLTGDDDISIRRKINEIMRAIALEKELSKKFRGCYIGEEAEVLLEEIKELQGKKYAVGHTRDYVKVAVPLERLDKSLLQGQDLGRNTVVHVKIEKFLTDEILTV